MQKSTKEGTILRSPAYLSPIPVRFGSVVLRRKLHDDARALREELRRPSELCHHEFRQPQ